MRTILCMLLILGCQVLADSQAVNFLDADFASCQKFSIEFLESFRFLSTRKYVALKKLGIEFQQLRVTKQDCKLRRLPDYLISISTPKGEIAYD